MKKTYLYFLVPLFGLIGFGAIYWNFSAGYEARELAKAKAIKEAKAEKLRLEAKNREIAIREAVQGQERRKKEREAKELKDRQDREAREAAIEAQRKARNDQDKFERTVARLNKEISTEKEIIAKILDDQKKLIDEDAFVKVYVKQAQSNAESLAKVLEKIAEADRKALEAAAAASAAAKAAKNS